MAETVESAISLCRSAFYRRQFFIQYFDNSLPSSDKDFSGESQQLWTGKNTQSNLRHDRKHKMCFAETKESVNPQT